MNKHINSNFTVKQKWRLLAYRTPHLFFVKVIIIIQEAGERIFNYIN